VNIAAAALESPSQIKLRRKLARPAAVTALTLFATEAPRQGQKYSNTVRTCSGSQRAWHRPGTQWSSGNTCTPNKKTQFPKTWSQAGRLCATRRSSSKAIAWGLDSENCPFPFCLWFSFLHSLRFLFFSELWSQVMHGCFSALQNKHRQDECPHPAPHSWPSRLPW
jgi:hypothetical protein